LKTVAFLLGIVVTAVSASAQTRGDTPPGGTAGNNTPPRSDGRSSRTTSTPSINVSSRALESGIGSPVTATSAPAAANAIAYYGSWLDDASVVRPGQLWVGLSTGYWRGSGSRQIDAPVASIVAGINSRMHAGGSLSFYHFRDADGLSQNGFGSMSLYTKVLLVDPSRAGARIGVAVSPLIELPPGSGESIGWALPVNVESRHARLRLYGSAGYFSRGSIFGTAAVEVPVSSRVSLTGSFGRAHADTGSQTSLGIGTFLTMTSTSGVFVGLGQTFMPEGIGPGGLSFAGGLSFFVADANPPSAP
jgi:hypothetical protein